MYDDLRQASISGGLTRDPELKYTGAGTAVLKLNVGSSESRKNQSGEYEKTSHYFEVTFWGKYAEVLSNKLSKGMKVLINGSLDFQQWETNGDKRSKIVVTGRFLQILSSNQQANSGANTQYNAPTGNNQGYQSNNGKANFEDDIHF